MANLEVVSNLTQVTELFNVASLFTDGILGVMILFVIFFGLLMFLSAFSRSDAFLAASFVTLIISILLRFIGIVNDALILFVLAVFISSLAASYFAKSGSPGA